ncbi:hypothetical protein PIB30_024930 [Stylosanthes scabra]|uniref:Aminotransferase-like plant mobile domain-containing protein n=1 Tax=Stylosanthes scabra TaxID=79078 RepID=A0ABU6UAB4_9FABA|nr:hypothetical protein [Stylosanthes scabra]
MLLCGQFAWTPYDALAWDALRPAWMLTEEEQRTWLAVVPIVCFMYVRMHHVDRVKRQLGSEQQIPEDPVNLDGFLTVSARGEDQHWPTRHQQWYDDWRNRFMDERQITITPTQYPAMPTQQYFDWWQDAYRVRFLSPADALDVPRLDALPDDVPATDSQPRDSVGSSDLTSGDRLVVVVAGEPQRPVGVIDSEEEAKYDRQEDVAGVAGDGGATGTQQTHDSGDGPVIGEDIPVDDAFFTGAEHHFQSSFGGGEASSSQQFMDPSMDFIATVSESQFGQVAGRYHRAREAATAAEHLAPFRAPPPVAGEDMSWIPPITLPSHGFASTAPAFPRLGTPPS